MSADTETRYKVRGRRRRASGRVAAAILLGITIVAVGVAGYLILSAAAPAGTAGSTTHSCAPANSPVCRGLSNSNGAVVPDRTVGGIG
jgi:hypothetical protein